MSAFFTTLVNNWDFIVAFMTGVTLLLSLFPSFRKSAFVQFLMKVFPQKKNGK